jgi:uncharacterized membrane protein (DUF2068 family)
MAFGMRCRGGVARIASNDLHPFEAADLIHRPTWFQLLVLVVNLIIVLYMLYLRLTHWRSGAPKEKQTVA